MEATDVLACCALAARGEKRTSSARYSNLRQVGRIVHIEFSRNVAVVWNEFESARHYIKGKDPLESGAHMQLDVPRWELTRGSRKGS